MFYFTKTKNETVKELMVNPKTGLNDSEVNKRREIYGFNKLPEEKKPSKILLFLKQFNNFFAYILAAATIISLLLKEYVDATVIFAAIIIDVVIGFIQENKAENVIASLRKIITVKVKVQRSGKIKLINSEDLVPGDIIFLDAGDKVPADARLLEAINLEINESALTGESESVEKKENTRCGKNTTIGERNNMVFSGTLVANGRAKAVVTEIGLKTEFGKIVSLLKKTKKEETPLQLKLKQLSYFIGGIVLVACFILFVVGFVMGKDLGEMFIFAVAVAVSAIPESLAVEVTIILAIGMTRILRRKSIVRKLLAAETLGSTTVICTDKTGTITTGKMVMEKFYKYNYKFKTNRFKQSDPELKKAAEIAMLCNNVYFQNTKGKPKNWKIEGDPTEKALVRFAGETGARRSTLDKKYKLVDEIPFDSYLKYMSVSFRDKEGNIHLFVKGATEKMMKAASHYQIDGKVKVINDKARDFFVEQNHKLSLKAFRNLTLAYKVIKNKKKIDIKKESTSGLTLLGIAAIRDPIRKNVKESLSLCREAGIKVKIITGDHKLTAKAIAADIGIKVKKDEILSGADMDRMRHQELEQRINNTRIFARVEPKHKVQIVDALQRQKEVVAMTGDGINDSPALKAADIGIAMGTGTEAAKESSDMILMNNNFKTIVAAVEEGRTIFDNIKKVVTYLMTDGFSEVILVIGSLIAGLPIPITPIQILWINLVGDGLPDTALTLEKGDKENMKEPPRKLKDPIIDKEMKTLIFVIGIVTDIVLFIIYLYLYYKTNIEFDHIRTFIFVKLSIDSLLYVFSIRNMRHSIFHVNPFSNKWLILAVLFGFSLTIGAIYIPFLQDILNTEPLNFMDWVYLLGIAVVQIIFIEIVKLFFFKKFHKNQVYK